LIWDERRGHHGAAKFPDVTIPILIAATYFLRAFIAASPLVSVSLALIVAWVIVALVSMAA
jgi:hypothetical protein